MNELDAERKPTAKEKAERLEQALLGVKQVDCPVRHFFAPGMYAREITIPAGCCLVGAIHKTENLAVLSKGTMRLVTDDGTVDIAAPHILTVKPGQKNAAFAIDECVWTNFLANPENEQDTDKLVEVFTFSKASDLLGGSTNKQLEANKLMEIEGS